MKFDKDITEKMIKSKKIILITILVFLILITSLLLIYGYKLNPYYLMGIIIIIPLYIILLKKYREYGLLKKLYQLRKDWGQEVKRDRDFEEIKLLYKKELSSREEENHIDEQTWHDLNLDAIYTKIDRTLTTPGESVLYQMLRTPSFDGDLLQAREQKITSFYKNRELRESIQLVLLKLGRQQNNSITKLLWDEIPSPAPFGHLFSLLALLGLLSVGLLFFLGGKGIIFIAVMMLVNSLVIRYFRKNYFNQLPTVAISYLASLIKTGIRIENIGFAVIEDERKRLKRLMAAGRKILKKSRYLLPTTASGDIDLIYQYLNTLFLFEVRSFNSSLYELKKNIKELQELYHIIGELDSYQSIASYRDSLTNFTVPEFTGDSLSLEMVDVYHPLLTDPVPNSIEIKDRGIIITGSNMAGKSTFLRTVGINVLFAQTISTCLASVYSGGFFRIITSISRTDNILASKSFYFVEAERLLKLLKYSERELPTLCIIDELLAGTNSLERLHASEEILNYLVKKNALAVVATHDLELAQKLQGQYKCYHFTDNVSKKTGLDFDYKIKEGLAVTSNAIKLLDYLGYPEEIVQKAGEKVVDKIKWIRNKDY